MTKEEEDKKTADKQKSPQGAPAGAGEGAAPKAERPAGAPAAPRVPPGQAPQSAAGPTPQPPSGGGSGRSPVGQGSAQTTQPSRPGQPPGKPQLVQGGQPPIGGQGQGGQQRPQGRPSASGGQGQGGQQRSPSSSSSGSGQGQRPQQRPQAGSPNSGSQGHTGQQPPSQPSSASQPQQGPTGGQKPAGQTNKPHIDWLRSKPVSGGARTPQQQRGLDLGRPDAWSGRYKPSGPGAGGQPAQGQPRPPAAPTPTRPQGAGQPSQANRPGQPYQRRPQGTTGMPLGRPSGGRPFGPTTQAPGWVKETTSTRRARSARRGGKQKERERPGLEEEIEEQNGRRPEAEGARARGAAGAGRPGVAKLSTVKGKLEPAPPEGSKAIVVPPQVTVKQLAELLDISSVEIIKELMKSGIMAPINQVIDFETAAIVASDLGFEIRPAETPEAPEPAPAEVVAEAPIKAAKLPDAEDDPSSLVPRPPVVTIMGHVDHGKTSLLDAIRRTNVAAGEFGGITQHIGAYQVEEKNQKITFLDTPGHEAFTAMRARGAQVTDIAVVVVAADDGVQPQTLEAINHARAANVPIIVALNKIDKDTANPERVKQQLADAGLVPEEWGGNTVVVPVSAKTGKGVSDLLDMILLVAEMASLKANPNRAAVGTIIEAEMDKTRGPMATVLVQKGTLKVGDYVVVGPIYGKIRAMFNDRGKAIRKATPSTPASILGLSDVPQSGDILRVMPDERSAREAAAQEAERLERAATTAAPPTLDLEKLSSMIAAGQVKELGIVLKADVQGSLEPIVNSLNKLGDEKENIKIRILHQATGMITESDVTLAAAARSAQGSKAAMVIGFNVEPDAAAKRTAEMQGVEIRTFKVIYDLVDAIEKALKGLYEPRYQEVVDGHAEVRQVFRLSKGVAIAGSFVTDGTVVRGAQARVRRNGEVVFDGKIGSLRRFKDDVHDVAAGFECGITLEGFNDIQEKDVIETYHMERMN